MTLSLDLTGRAAVLQRLRVLLTTTRGSVPLDRGFGLDPDLLDQPGRRLAALVRADVLDQVQRYIPEASVTRIDVAPTGADGRLVVSLTVEIDGEAAVVEGA